MSNNLPGNSRLVVAFALQFIGGCLFVVVHLYATYIAYADGLLPSLITFGAVGLSDIFWFGVAWRMTGSPFSAYGSLFLAALAVAGVGSLLGRVEGPARTTWFVRWRIDRALRAVTRKVYGGDRDFDACLSICRFYRLSMPVSLAIIAVVAASKTQFRGPIEPKLVHQTISEREQEAADAGSNVQDVIELQRAYADREIARANAEFEIESMAPPYSFHGLVSRYERAAQRPLTFEEREKLRTLAREIESLDSELRDRKIAEIVAQNLNHHVLKASPSRQSGDGS